MRNALVVAVVGLVTVCLAGCGDADTAGGGIPRGRSTVGAGSASGAGSVSGAAGSNAAGLPNDSSEEPGAPADADNPANPNSSSTPSAPATPGTTAGELAVTLSTATPSTDLGTSLDLTVTVEPKQNFKGEAALSVTGLPAGVVATFSPAKVTLNTTAAKSKLTLQVPYGTLPSAKDAASAIVVKAAAGAVEATANANFKVNPRVTLTIPVNAAALIAAGGGAQNVDGWGGPTFGANATPLQTQVGNGITFIVKNADSTPHEVHGQGGFPHGDVKVAPGGVDPKSRVLNPANGTINASGYIHGEANGTAVGFKVIVKPAP
jgi:hypothetical protein